MCLWWSRAKAVREASREIKAGKKHTFYKVYELYKGRLYGCYFGVGAIRPGLIKSDRGQKSLTPDERNSKRVDHGIHVFYSRADAKQRSNSRNKAVPVTAKLDDLVRVGLELGNAGAVFMKVRLSQKAYDKAIAQGDSP